MLFLIIIFLIVVFICLYKIIVYHNLLSTYKDIVDEVVSELKVVEQDLININSYKDQIIADYESCINLINKLTEKENILEKNIQEENKNSYEVSDNGEIEDTSTHKYPTQIITDLKK